MEKNGFHEKSRKSENKEVPATTAVSLKKISGAKWKEETFWVRNNERIMKKKNRDGAMAR